MMGHFVCGHLKNCWFRQILFVMWKPAKAIYQILQPAARCCTSQFESCSKHRSFSCFVCVHVFMSLMWFFYPRASSGTLSQESKCGTPVTASSSPICLCVCACMHVYVRTQIYVRGIHKPPRLCTFMYAWMCSWWHTLSVLVAQELSPHSPGLLLGKAGKQWRVQSSFFSSKTE